MGMQGLGALAQGISSGMQAGLQMQRTAADTQYIQNQRQREQYFQSTQDAINKAGAERFKAARSAVDAQLQGDGANDAMSAPGVDSSPGLAPTMPGLAQSAGAPPASSAQDAQAEGNAATPTTLLPVMDARDAQAQGTTSASLAPGATSGSIAPQETSAPALAMASQPSTATATPGAGMPAAGNPPVSMGASTARAGSVQPPADGATATVQGGASRTPALPPIVGRDPQTIQMHTMLQGIEAMQDKAAELGRGDLLPKYFQDAANLRDQLRQRSLDAADNAYRLSGDPSGYVQIYNNYVKDGFHIDDFSRQADGSFHFAATGPDGKQVSQVLSPSQAQQQIMFLRNPQAIRQLEATSAAMAMKSNEEIRVRQAKDNSEAFKTNASRDPQQYLKTVQNGSGQPDSIMDVRTGKIIHGPGAPDFNSGAALPNDQDLKWMGDIEKQVFSNYGSNSLNGIQPEKQEEARQVVFASQAIYNANKNTANASVLTPSLAFDVGRAVALGQAKPVWATMKDGSKQRVVNYAGRSYFMDPSNAYATGNPTPASPAPTAPPAAPPATQGAGLQNSSAMTRISGQEVAGKITQAAPQVPSAAIAYLRANPNFAPQFQQKYGVDPKQYLPRN